MSEEFEWTTRRKQIAAVYWDGNNRDEVKRYFDRYINNEIVGELGPYFSRDEYPDDPYNTVQFYYSDDHEVDPGMWIVLVLEDETIHIVPDTYFRQDFER